MRFSFAQRSVYMHRWGTQANPVLKRLYLRVTACRPLPTFTSSSPPYQLVTFDPRLVDNCQCNVILLYHSETHIRQDVYLVQRSVLFSR
jgi:hypothetical protein